MELNQDSCNHLWLTADHKFLQMTAIFSLKYIQQWVLEPCFSHYFLTRVKLLFQLNHGADPTMKNQEGQTPYDLTTADDVKALIEAAMPQLPILSTTAQDPNSSQSANG